MESIKTDRPIDLRMAKNDAKDVNEGQIKQALWAVKTTGADPLRTPGNH